MTQKETSEFITRPAEEYWYASRIQRAVEKHLKDAGHSWDGFDDNQRDGIFVEHVARIRRERPLFWLIIGTDAQRLMHNDISKKADMLGQIDEAFLSKTNQEKFDAAKKALIYDYWEISQKPQRLLKMLREELLKDVDNSTRGA
jgi:hypothetical protein